MEPQNEIIHRFDCPSEAAEQMQLFTQAGFRSLDIFTLSLIPELYCTNELVTRISAFARANAISKVRILVKDTRPLHGANHALVSLAQRLPSHIQIRQLQEDTSKHETAFFCVDQKHLVFFNDEANFVGFARENAAVESKHYTEQFNYDWQGNSKTDPNLRVLAL